MLSVIKINPLLRAIKIVSKYPLRMKGSKFLITGPNKESQSPYCKCQLYSILLDLFINKIKVYKVEIKTLKLTNG